VAAATAARRVFVAGGVGPANVEGVLRSVPGLFGVDVCSAIETSPGVKDPELLEQLFARLHVCVEEQHG
jgi:phosphoribosylanthranilate isomerase